MAVRLLYENILSNFPQKNLQLVFAYGSGVFKQTGRKDISKNMIDFIFAVDNPVEWHKENFERNPKHYSFLRYLGAAQIAKIQENFAARIYFNTLVPCKNRLIKYGVISKSALINDLFDWETLYVSGRLHKPVCMIHSAQERNLDIALQSNLQSAMHTALLLLPDEFSEAELYTTITSLSYSGDFRMKVGEDKNKVSNIVQPNMEMFRELYEHILDNEDHVHFNKSQGLLEQSLSAMTRYHHLSLLPKCLMAGLVAGRNVDGRNRDTEEVIRSLAHDSDCPEYINTCISSIVQRSSLMQSAKGIFTAGLSKSWRYSLSKLQKMWKSQRQ